MNFTQCPTLDRMPNTLDLSQLEKSSEPAHEVLSKLIHHCSPDPATRTALSTALVLSLWQLRADSLTQDVPSLILLNAGESAPDPVDDFIATFTSEEADDEPQKSVVKNGFTIDRENAPRVMTNAIIERRRLGSASNFDSQDAKNANAWEGIYEAAKDIGFGRGTARPYSKAWSDEFGFLTDENNVLIARLNGGPDRVAFRRDVIEAPNKLYHPIGIGRGLQAIPKKFSVSGSLTVDLWDEQLVLGIIQLGLPILFIPHTAKDLLSISNPWALDAFPSLWRNADVSRARTSLMLPPTDWFEAHAESIRRRLRMLPGPGTYEFAVLQVLHQLGNVCALIAEHAGRNYKGKPQHTAALLWDLHARAVRGITLGVSALAWHGLGFDPGCPPDKAVKVLRGLRTNGPMSSNEIRRRYHLESKVQRDTLLERLVAEDLVQIEGNTVTAVSFEGFVTALNSRPGLPEAANFRKAADGEDQVKT